MTPVAYVAGRGDFVRVVLDSCLRSEQSGERPAPALTDRRFNELTGYAAVAPVAGTARHWRFEIPVPPGGRVEGVVLTDQIGVLGA